MYLSERKRGTNKSPNHWFSPPPCLAQPGLVCQELWLRALGSDTCRSPLSHHLLNVRVCSSRKLESTVEFGLETRPPQMEYGHPTTAPNPCSHSPSELPSPGGLTAFIVSLPLAL